MLLDLSETTSFPSSGQLTVVTTEVARVGPRVEFDGCAIIASQDALFEMARMFEVFAEIRWLASHDIGPNREVPTCSSCC